MDDFDRIIYFAARSDVGLKTVCNAIQDKYQLPDFEFDCESPDDEYGFSRNERIGFNITKTDSYDEIKKWMESAPKDVNFQIILFFYSNGASDYDVEKIQAFLHATIKAQADKYHEW